MMRKRRGSLNGWWSYLPFVLVPCSLLFSEVWFQTRILHNEYKKNALRVSIREAELRKDELDDEIRGLARMERVLELAPDLGLGPPNPGQVIDIRMAAAPAQNEEQIAMVAPVLAAGPPVARAIAIARIEPSIPHTQTLILKELEPLEPALDWVE